MAKLHFDDSFGSTASREITRHPSKMTAVTMRALHLQKEGTVVIVLISFAMVTIALSVVILYLQLYARIPGQIEVNPDLPPHIQAMLPE